MSETVAKRIKVPPTSRLATLIREAEADGEPLIIDVGATAYTVRVEDAGSPFEPSTLKEASAATQESLWEGYDPDAALAAFRAAAGSWSDVDADELIAKIYRWREAGSRPMDRP